MDAALTWIDLTARDRDKMRQILDLFKEQGTIDEMGLGTLRDAFSDALFPGTSTIQTRLRYVLFVPWIYRQLEASSHKIDDVAKRSRNAELALIRPLQGSKDPDGTIGVRAGGALARLPSSVYWTALVRWGIFQHEQSQSWYHTHFDRLANQRDVGVAADDPGVIETHRPNWHPRLPDRTPSFPADVAFALTRDEAVFLQGRIEERCAGTLLAWLACEGTDAPPDGCYWHDSAASNASTDIRQIIEISRRFSLHVEGMPLLYNLLLAERRHAEHGGDDELIDYYRSELEDWAARESEELSFDPDSLWNFIASRNIRTPSPSATLRRTLVATHLRENGNRSSRRFASALVDRISRKAAQGTTGSVAQFGTAPRLERSSWRGPNELPLAPSPPAPARPAHRTHRLMLSPESRTVAFELLRPPAGRQLDFALLTSYTLDLEALLALPLSVVSRAENGHRGSAHGSTASARSASSGRSAHSPFRGSGGNCHPPSEARAVRDARAQHASCECAKWRDLPPQGLGGPVHGGRRRAATADCSPVAQPDFRPLMGYRTAERVVPRVEAAVSGEPSACPIHSSPSGPRRRNLAAGPFPANLGSGG